MLRVSPSSLGGTRPRNFFSSYIRFRKFCDHVFDFLFLLRFSGTLIQKRFESVFSIPGLGRYFVQSIQNRDYPVIMGTTIFLAAFIILMNLVVDLLYKVADPRISLAKGGE